MDKEGMNALELANMADGEAAAERLSKSFETEWKPMGISFLALRTYSMRVNRTNQPKGRGYNETYSAVLLRYPHLAAVNEVVRAALLNCMENIVEITAWREGLALDGKIKWNSPRDVWKQFQLYKKAKAPKPDGGTPKPAKTKDDIILDLQAEIAAYKKVGDVQLCSKDSAKANVQAMECVFGEDKLRAIAKEILIALDVPPEVEKEIRKEARAAARRKS